MFNPPHLQIIVSIATLGLWDLILQPVANRGTTNDKLISFPTDCISKTTILVFRCAKPETCIKTYASDLAGADYPVHNLFLDCIFALEL